MGGKQRYHYQYHHNYLTPPQPLQLLQSKRWVKESREEKPQKLGHTLIHVLIQFSTSNIERHYQPMRRLKVKIGNIKFWLYILLLHALPQLSLTWKTLRAGSAWPCNRSFGPGNAHLEKTKKNNEIPLINKSLKTPSRDHCTNNNPCFNL